LKHEPQGWAIEGRRGRDQGHEVVDSHCSATIPRISAPGNTLRRHLARPDARQTFEVSTREVKNDLLATLTRGDAIMLWTVFVILLVMWLLGMVSSYTLGGFIHLLLVLALVVMLINIIQGRRPVV